MPQFTPRPTAAPLQNASINVLGKNGPYGFGFPDVLVRINFPEGGPSQARPWYWFFPRQRPSYFSFLAPQGGWGPGWVCKPIFGVIKILPIDTQPEIPVPPVGFTTLEGSIDNGVPNGNFGRFQFTEDFFWRLIGVHKPIFEVHAGLPTSRYPKGNIGKVINDAVKLWKNDWNLTAQSFNGSAQSVGGDGSYGGVSSAFALPLPPPNSSIPVIQNIFQDIFFGPVPPTYVFETGMAGITKQGYGFTIDIGQLDPRSWDMSRFPPIRVEPGRLGVPESSALSGDFGGYSGGVLSFPFVGPILV